MSYPTVNVNNQNNTDGSVMSLPTTAPTNKLQALVKSLVWYLEFY